MTETPSPDASREASPKRSPENLERLFLLEILVDNVEIEYEKLKLDKDVLNSLKQACVRFQFLNYPPLDICEEDFCNVPEDYQKDKIEFKSGKSCLFSLRGIPPDIRSMEICVTVNRQRDSQPCVDLGKTKISLGSSFTNILNCLEAQNNNGTVSRTSKDIHPLFDANGKPVGKICVFIRLSCFGKMIITQFQTSGDANRSFLFKGAPEGDEMEGADSMTSYPYICDNAAPGGDMSRNLSPTKQESSRRNDVLWAPNAGTGHADGDPGQQQNSPCIQGMQSYPGQDNVNAGSPQIPGYSEGPQGQGYLGSPQNQGFTGSPQRQGYPGSPQGLGYPGSPQGQGYPGSPQGLGYPGSPQGLGNPGSPQGQGYPGNPQGQGYPGSSQGQGYPGNPQGQTYPGSPQGLGYPGNDMGFQGQGYPGTGTGFSQAQGHPGNPMGFQAQGYPGNLMGTQGPSNLGSTMPYQSAFPGGKFGGPQGMSGFPGMPGYHQMMRSPPRSRAEGGVEKDFKELAVEINGHSLSIKVPRRKKKPKVEPPPQIPFCGKVGESSSTSESEEESTIASPQPNPYNFCGCDIPSPPGFAQPPPPKIKKKKKKKNEKKCPLEMDGSYCMKQNCPMGYPTIPCPENPKETQQFTTPPGAIGLKGDQVIFQMASGQQGGLGTNPNAKYSFATNPETNLQKVQMMSDEQAAAPVNLDPMNDVFLLKVGKNNNNKRSIMNVEVKSPKKVEQKTVDDGTQYEDPNAPPKPPKGAKGDGKKGDKGKKGGKGKKGKK